MLHELVVSDELNSDDKLPLDESTRGNKLLSPSLCFLLLLLLSCLDGIAAKFLLSFGFRPPLLFTGLGESLSKKRIFSDINRINMIGLLTNVQSLTLHREACMLPLVIQSLTEQGKPANSESKSRSRKRKYIASLSNYSNVIETYIAVINPEPISMKGFQVANIMTWKWSAHGI